MWGTLCGASRRDIGGSALTQTRNSRKVNHLCNTDLRTTGVSIHCRKSASMYILRSLLISALLLFVCPLLFDLFQLHVDAFEAPAFPEGRVQERSQIKAIVVRRCSRRQFVYRLHLLRRSTYSSRCNAERALV